MDSQQRISRGPNSTHTSALGRQSVDSGQRYRSIQDSTPYKHGTLTTQRITFPLLAHTRYLQTSRPLAVPSVGLCPLGIRVQDVGNSETVVSTFNHAAVDGVVTSVPLPSREYNFDGSEELQIDVGDSGGGVEASAGTESTFVSIHRVE